jgi:hypothetical protein
VNRMAKPFLTDGTKKEPHFKLNHAPPKEEKT